MFQPKVENDESEEFYQYSAAGKAEQE